MRISETLSPHSNAKLKSSSHMFFIFKKHLNSLPYKHLGELWEIAMEHFNCISIFLIKGSEYSVYVS